MSRLQALTDIVVGSRIVTRDRWNQAVREGGGNLDRILASLAESPPDWWDGNGSPPPGLTDYQRNIIRARVTDGEIELLGRDLALNQFLLLDKLGEGGQGEVFRAWQLNPPRFAAVKTIVQRTEVRRARFEQEARTMIQIRHPAIARFYLYERVRDTSGEPTDEYLIAMELVNGTDLFQLVRRSGTVRWPIAAKWIADLLGGLAAIHKHGFIHRDVKPENVMAVGAIPGPHTRPEQTSAKLLDFGAVRQTDSADQEPGAGRTFIGTVEYAPPEQWTGKVVEASDIYPLGGALYFVLTGRSPYQLEKRDSFKYRDAHRNDPIPDLRDRNPDVPPELNQLFRQMMAKDPADRGSAEDLMVEFQKLIGLEPKPTTTPRIPTSTQRAQPVARAQPAEGNLTVRPPATRLVEHDAGPKGVFRIVDGVLAIFESLFIPGYRRPAPGEEAGVVERVAALLRRPPVFLILAIVIGFLLWWAL